MSQLRVSALPIELQPIAHELFKSDGIPANATSTFDVGYIFDDPDGKIDSRDYQHLFLNTARTNKLTSELSLNRFLGLADYLQKNGVVLPTIVKPEADSTDGIDLMTADHFIAISTLPADLQPLATKIFGASLINPVLAEELLNHVQATDKRNCIDEFDFTYLQTDHTTITNGELSSFFELTNYLRQIGFKNIPENCEDGILGNAIASEGFSDKQVTLDELKHMGHPGLKNGFYTSFSTTGWFHNKGTHFSYTLDSTGAFTIRSFDDEKKTQVVAWMKFRKDGKVLEMSGDGTMEEREWSPSGKPLRSMEKNTLTGETISDERWDEEGRRLEQHNDLFDLKNEFDKKGNLARRTFTGQNEGHTTVTEYFHDSGMKHWIAYDADGEEIKSGWDKITEYDLSDVRPH